MSVILNPLFSTRPADDTAPFTVSLMPGSTKATLSYFLRDKRSRSLPGQQQTSHQDVNFNIYYAVGLVSLEIERAFIFIASWFFTSLANLILLGQQTGAPPATGVCLMQAVLIYAYSPRILVKSTIRRTWRASGQSAALLDHAHVSPDVATWVILFSFRPILALVYLNIVLAVRLIFGGSEGHVACLDVLQMKETTY
ncbi:hypothetical protein BDZ97DRAFT_1755535 [Flammula alnicola]|nr:hypothetical protein BDZ97DRAFT_1755535 [Flammula alnicola]